MAPYCFAKVTTAPGFSFLGGVREKLGEKQREIKRK